MTGLEKVTGKIIADAEADARVILEKAQAECEAIKERYAAETEAEIEKLINVRICFKKNVFSYNSDVCGSVLDIYSYVAGLYKEEAHSTIF